MQKISTYHLDQNIRGFISKGLIRQNFFDGKYYPEKYEAILPLATIEYAGTPIRKVLSKIENPPEEILLSKPLSLRKIKEYFNSQIEKNYRKIV